MLVKIKSVLIYFCSFSTIILILFSVNTFAQLPAFPGAEGFGAQTIGGRGGRVIKVTNTNDHGPGSLREAIETEEPRIIIFNTGGIINLETPLIIQNPYITIAGQTAPGDGICIRGHKISVETHDVVIRYLRIRPGDINFGRMNNWSDIDAITIGGINQDVFNVLIDHCSLSWAVDENIGMWNSPHDITIQNCIISEALHRSKHPKGSHGMGMLIGSKATNISIHHNLFAHNNDRNPHINGESKVDFRNNVIYNAGGVASDIAANRGQMLNYINNYIIEGPRTRIPAELIIRNLKRHTTKIFIYGNIGIKKNPSNVDNWLLTFDTESKYIPDRNIQLDEAFHVPNVNTHTAEQALDYVLENAGAVLPRQDAVDRKVIRDVLNNKDGMVNKKDYLLAWPPFDAGMPFADSDIDGMPDHWEEKHDLNVNYNDSSEDPDKDGYTNIEEYLNNTDPVPIRGDQTFSIRTLDSDNTNNKSYPQVDFAIKQNYPNPFSESTDIEFSIDRPSRVTLKAINIDGKEVYELINGFLYEGKYHILWDTSRAPTGIYQLYLESDHDVKAVKAVLAR